MHINSKNIFLIDGLGALLTAFLTGAILIFFVEYFGMPQNILVTLVAVACIFAVYSLTCHFLKPKNWRLFLVFIAILNLVYCAVLAGFAIHFAVRLTLLGISYFTAEVMVVLILVYVELCVAFSKNVS
jgi:hypothetical protein